METSCEHCDQPFTRPPASQRRFCSVACRRASEAIRRTHEARRDRRRAKDTRARPQLTVVLPRQPDLSRGICATGALPANYWFSPDVREREAARLACLRCPVLEACRAWSLSLPSADAGIFGGLTKAGRLRLKQAAMAGKARIEREAIRIEEREAASAGKANREHEIDEREAARREKQREYSRNCERRRRLLGKAPTPEQRRERYARNPEPRLAAARAYYAEHAEVVKAKRRARYARQRASQVA